MSCWRSTMLRKTSRERGPATEILRPLVANGGELHVEFRPQPLVAELHVLQDLGRVGGGGGDDKAILAEARGGAVVQHESVFAQHEAVARLADGEGLPAVGVKALQELGCVAHPAGRSCRASRRRKRPRSSERCAPRGSRSRASRPRRASRIPLRAQPIARLDEHGALLLRPRWEGGSRVGLKSLPRCVPASAPIATGVKGGRNVVVPVCGMVRAVNSAISARPVRRWRSCPGRWPCRAWCSA